MEMLSSVVLVWWSEEEDESDLDEGWGFKGVGCAWDRLKPVNIDSCCCGYMLKPVNIVVEFWDVYTDSSSSLANTYFVSSSFTATVTP